MKIKYLLIATLLGASLLSTAALAQNNRGQNQQGQNAQQQGQGWGGQGYEPGYGRGFHHGTFGGGRGGMGGGYGMMGGGFGGQMMQLMTQDEWINFRIKMRETKTFEECKTVQSAHFKLLETRAKEKNIAFVNPEQNGWNRGPCERMKYEGILK